jgi:hypothetical protein
MDTHTMKQTCISLLRHIEALLLLLWNPASPQIESLV